MIQACTLFVMLFLLQGNHARAQELDLSSVLALDKPISGNFRQVRSVSGIERDFVTEGSFTVIGQQALIWTVKSPAPMRIAFTEDSVEYLDGDDHINKGISRYVSRLVRDIMTLRILSNEEFDSAITGNVSAWELELKPRRKAVKRHLRRVVIKGDKFIRNLNVVSGNGDQTEISFTDIVYREDLPEGLCQAIDIQSEYCSG
ncbi:MAG: outer membrane lipoprotein carrier protein LolA [Pseudomonadales bacterium]